MKRSSRNVLLVKADSDHLKVKRTSQWDLKAPLEKYGNMQSKQIDFDSPVQFNAEVFSDDSNEFPDADLFSDDELR